ncbi:hypothetical protein IKT64_01520 [Candidatus Saccharibacteria bacterium]|nr:hypothetical protein [Candidatus Saccharibacteria bacterium]
MKKIILAFGLLLTFLPINASACVNGPEGTDANCEETVEQTEQTRFSVGDNLVTSGEKKKSSFFAGSEITDSSLVTGPAFVAGNKLDLSGKYEYGFHVGNGVTINGTYEKDLFAVGNSLVIEKDAKLPRDVFIAGNVVTIRADISGDVFIAANKLVLENVAIEGDLNVVLNTLEIKGEVKIGKTLTRNNDAKVSGEFASVGKEEVYEKPQVSINPIMSTLFALGGKLVVMLIFMLIGKKFFKKLVDFIQSATGEDMKKAVWIGLAAIVAAPLAALALLFTVVGVPAALVIGGLYVILMYLGSIITAVYLNERFLKIKNGMIGATLGLTILSVLCMAPYLGSLIGLIASVFGASLMIRILFWND